jgi:hypothetical protein
MQTAVLTKPEVTGISKLKAVARVTEQPWWMTMAQLWNDTDGKTEVLVGTPVPAQLFPPQIPRGVAYFPIYACVSPGSLYPSGFPNKILFELNTSLCMPCCLVLDVVTVAVFSQQYK